VHPCVGAIAYTVDSLGLHAPGTTSGVFMSLRSCSVAAFILLGLVGCSNDDSIETTAEDSGGSTNESHLVEDTASTPTTELTPVDSQPESVVEGSVDILTAESDTDFGEQALSSLTLQHDLDLNCLYHDEPDNNGEPGTGGRVVDGGEVAVLDATGTTVARTNIAFTIGGGGRGANIDHCNAIGIWLAHGPPIS
jgi:hypothetical protein